MKKFKLLSITFFLIIVFTCANDCLFGIVNDLQGKGTAHWGMTKEQIYNKFDKRIKLNEVALVRGGDFIIVNYRKGTVTRHKYEFDKNRLYKLTATYSHSTRRILKTYNGKYKNYDRIENNTYIWTFPSTVITHIQGTNYTVFIDRRYVKAARASKNIDDIRIGMSSDEVRNLMGTPTATATATGGITTYRYRTGIITFQYLKVTKIEKLSGVVQVSPGVVPVQSNIDRITIGMTLDEVRNIMGQPLSSTSLGGLTVWRYNSGAISFKFQKVAKIEKTK